MKFDEKETESIFEKLKKTEIDEETLNEAENKAAKLNDLYDDFMMVISMVKDSIKGNFKIPTKSLVMMIAAIGYVVMPIDALPDFLPLGFIDDIAVVGMVLKSINDIMDKYKKYKKDKDDENNGDGSEIVIEIDNKLL